MDYFLNILYTKVGKKILKFIGMPVLSVLLRKLSLLGLHNNTNNMVDYIFEITSTFIYKLLYSGRKAQSV